MSLSAQREKRKRNGTREGPVIKVGWQASTAAAARFSDRAKERGFAQGRRFHAISSEQATLASCWRSIWPAFWLYPITALRKAHGVLAVDAACAGKPAAPTQRDRRSPRPRERANHWPCSDRSETPPWPILSSQGPDRPLRSHLLPIAD